MGVMEFALPFIYKGSDRSTEQQCTGNPGLDSVSSKSECNYEDANVVCLHLSQMVIARERRCENPIHCWRCGAILNHLSTITTTEDGRNTWCCEFCCFENGVYLPTTWFPPSDGVTYEFRLSSDAIKGLDAQGASKRDDSVVVFCIDTSGSMGQLVELPVPVKVKDESGRFRMERIVTRLQVLQAAIVSKLQNIMLEYPTRRVAVIAFDDNVTYLGDGSPASWIVFSKHNLQSVESLLSAASNLPPLGSVSTTFQELSSAVYKLEEGGFTALGAAATISIALAGRWPGSKVVLCCDGPENMGVVGENIQSKDARLFYDELGEYAAKHGVSVSIIVTDKASCELSAISTLALRTNGKIIKDSITTLSGQLDEVIRDNVLAFHAGATFVTSPDICVQNFSGCDATHTTAFSIGIVKTSSDRTIKLGIRKDTEPWRSVTDFGRQPIDAASLVVQSKVNDRMFGLLQPRVNKQTVGDLPIVYLQARVDYTTMYGAKCLSVFTAKIPIVSDQSPCLEGIRRPVIGMHGAHIAARLVYQFQFDEAKRVLDDLKCTLLALGSSQEEVSRCTGELTFICCQAQEQRLQNDDAVMMAIRKLTDGLAAFDSYNSEFMTTPILT